MATLYSHTFEGYTGANALPGTYELTGLVTGGATHATISSITVKFYKSTNGDYNMRCRIKNPAGDWGDYSYEDVTWAGETTQIIAFTFADVSAKVTGNKFEVQLSKNTGPASTTYLTYDGDGSYFVVEGAWEGVLPGDPHTPVPGHEATEITSFTLSWDDGGNTDTFDVYFRAFGEFFEKIASDITDLFVSVEEFLYDNRYNYGELYLWCVIAKNGAGVNYAPPSDFGIGYGGTIWEFNAAIFKPPLPTGITLDYSGGTPGVPTGTPTGENNMMAVRRLIAAADNKIWIEDV